MKIQNDTTYLNDLSRSSENQKMSNNEDAKNVFAGDLNLPQDRVLEKQLKAQEQALKLIMDARAIDKKIDGDLAKRQQNVKDLKTDLKACNDELSRISEEKAELYDKYGLDDAGNKEDLALLNRAQNGRNESFTKDELERLDFLRKDGRLLEYQERFDELDKWHKFYDSENEKMTNTIIAENRAISKITYAREPLTHMRDAMEGAEDILKSASDEITNMIYEDSVEHIKEESDKKEQEAEKIAEKQKEQQEFIEKTKEKSKNDDHDHIEKATKNMLSLEKDAINIQAEAKKIINKLNLIEEDIKGTVVNKTT